MSVLNRTALAAALLAAAPLAFAAGSADDQMIVSIQIENSCTIEAGDMSFGSATSLAGDLDATADVTLDCSNQGPVEVSFSAGSSGDQLARAMQGPSGATISYQLYDDAARTNPLGDGAGGTVTLADTSTGSEQVFTVYGRVPAQGAKPIGAYSDSITATVSF